MKPLQELVRPTHRGAFCRVCDKEIQKGENMFSIFSRRNRGQHIHICKSCIELRKELKMNEGSGYA